MLTQEQIEEQVELVVDAIKAVKNKAAVKYIKFDKGDEIWKKPVLPDFYPNYLTAIDWLRRIEVHAKKDVVPYELLSNRSPNQTDKEWEWSIANYKQSTLPVFQDFLNTIQRAWHDATWDLSYNEEEKVFSEQSIQHYMDEGLTDTPLGMSLETYMKGVVPAIKEMDAMGVLAVRPWRIETVMDDGVEVISGELHEPIPIYFDSSQVVGFLENKWYLLESHKKSIVDYRNQKMRIGHVFEFYDDTNVWRITQVGKYTDYEFVYEIYYEHDLGYVPVTRLKGIPVTENGDILWQSPFLMVVDILDQAVLDDCNLRAVKANSTYPYRTMVGDLCEYKEMVDGHYVNCVNGILNLGSSLRQCPDCGGTGAKDRLSPLGQMVLKPQTGILNEGDTIKPADAIAYHSPKIDTPQFLRKEFTEFMAASRQILHLKTTNTLVKGSEDMTATGVVFDEKSKYAFIKTPSDQLFDLYLFLLDTIGKMRYGKNYKGVKLHYPTIFDFKTEADYLEEISKASQANLPPYVVSSIIEKFMKSLYFSDESVSTKYETIVAADRLMSLSSEDIALKSARGLIADWEIILHDSSLLFVRELVEEDDGYLKLPLDERVRLLENKAKDRAKLIEPDVSNVDQVLNNLANGSEQGTSEDT